jgi:hypothetical protein
MQCSDIHNLHITVQKRAEQSLHLFYSRVFKCIKYRHGAVG